MDREYRLIRSNDMKKLILLIVLVVSIVSWAARKDYYYIDADGNHCELSTGNLDHQIKIEAHILKYAKKDAKKDAILDKSEVIVSTKSVLVDGKIVVQDQDFVTVLEPFDLSDVVEDVNDVEI